MAVQFDCLNEIIFSNFKKCFVFIFTCKGYDAQGVELKLDRRGRGRGRLKKGVANLAM